MMSMVEMILSLAFGIYVITGIVVGYFASNLLLTFIAYFSPWMPVWMWYIDMSLYGIAIAIAASGTVGVIAVLSKRGKAIKMCWFILTGLFSIELMATGLTMYRRCFIADSLESDMKDSMMISQGFYSTNISDTQMWDEIQMEVNCCGIQSYEDWFKTSYGSKGSVPDSCCLLVSQDCGSHIASHADPADLIVTEGCLPSIMKLIGKEVMGFGSSLLPFILGTQFFLLILMLYFVHQKKNRPRLSDIFVSQASAFDPAFKYQPLTE